MSELISTDTGAGMAMAGECTTGAGGATRRLILIITALVALMLLQRPCCCTAASQPGSSQTRPPALILFGDSIVDPGNNNGLTTAVRCDFAPYGQDFPAHNATGRFSNGKIVGDILGMGIS